MNALKNAERLFSERGETGKLQMAVDELARVRDPDNRNFEVEWKFAKYSFFLGKSQASESEAITIFDRGKNAALIASRVDASKPDGHFWYGANLGELSRISPITVGIKSADDIREAMHIVIEIDPAYQGSSAYDALGQLEMATRTLGRGTTEKAIEYLEKGVSISPGNSNLRLHLAEALLSAKRDNEARKQFDVLFKMEPPAGFEAEHRAAFDKGKTIFNKNF